MCSIVRHRGPDSQGIKMDGSVGIGARCLSIIDLLTGDQPISNEDGTIWAVLNGEIYNHVVLRRDLKRKGHEFRSKTDTEVLVHLYEEFGERSVEHCNGMFAFCVYDSRRKRLFLARDRVGKKPLFNIATQRYLFFALAVCVLYSVVATTHNHKLYWILLGLTEVLRRLTLKRDDQIAAERISG